MIKSAQSFGSEEVKQQNSPWSNSAVCFSERAQLPAVWHPSGMQMNRRTGHSKQKRLTERKGSEKSKATGQLGLGLKRNSPFVEAGWGLWRSHYFFHHLGCGPSTQEWIQWCHVPLSSEQILPFPRRGRKHTGGNYIMQITQISVNREHNLFSLFRKLWWCEHLLTEGLDKHRPEPVESSQFLPNNEQDKLREVTDSLSFWKQVSGYTSAAGMNPVIIMSRPHSVTLSLAWSCFWIFLEQVLCII